MRVVDGKDYNMRVQVPKSLLIDRADSVVFEKFVKSLVNIHPPWDIEGYRAVYLGCKKEGGVKWYQGRFLVIRDDGRDEIVSPLFQFCDRYCGKDYFSQRQKDFPRLVSLHTHSTHTCSVPSFMTRVP